MRIVQGLAASLAIVALSTRSTPIGASAALLGAVPLMFGATMTPVAGYLVERSASIWLLGLLVLGLLATLLAALGARWP